MLAGLAAQRAGRRPATVVIGRDAVALDARQAAARPWLGRAVAAERTTRRWRTGGDGPPEWASERHVAERAERWRQRADAWQRQADELRPEPDGRDAARVSARRAREAGRLAAYWAGQGGPARGRRAGVRLERRPRRRPTGARCRAADLGGRRATRRPAGPRRVGCRLGVAGFWPPRRVSTSTWTGCVAPTERPAARGRPRPGPPPRTPRLGLPERPPGWCSSGSPRAGLCLLRR